MRVGSNNSCLHTEGVAKLKVETTTRIEGGGGEREGVEANESRRLYAGNVEWNVS